MEYGEVAEMGTHQELMERQGHYYKLFQVQQLDQ
jgi:ATP-binding cassette, subfamily B, putative efflux pump